MQLEGNDVTAAYAGQRAPAFRPDIAFLDIGLPGMNGMRSARKLLLPSLRTIRLIAVTSDRPAAALMAERARSGYEPAMSSCGRHFFYPG